MAQHIGPGGCVKPQYGKAEFPWPVHEPALASTQDIIRDVMGELTDWLVAKNEQYGDSVVSPINIFAKGATPELLIKSRIDDKIKRLVEGDDSVEPDEDILKDLAGYYIMLQVCRRKHATD